MKNYILGLIFCFTAFTLSAQVKTPSASPSSKVTQSVGLTDFTLEYSRPGVKGRKIFGDLVPYGSKWRTGANSSTKVEFTTPVTFAGQDVEAGKYAIYTIPGESMWSVMLTTDLRGVGSAMGEWDESKVAANFEVKSMKAGATNETMLINFNNITNNSATLDICWENTLVSIPVSVPSDKMVQESIDKVMAGPSAGDYYNAARYYRESGKDLTTALEWMNKSLEMNGEKFWTLRQKALLLADMGKTKEAIEVAKKSIEMAKEAGNMDYVKNNEKSIAEWMK